MDTGLMDAGGGALVNGGAGAAASAASTRSAISAIQPDIELEERGLIGCNSTKGVEEAGCVKAHNPLDHQTAIELKIEHALYNGHLKWTSKPYLLGQRDRQNSASSAAWQLQGVEHGGGQHCNHRNPCSW